MQLTAAQLQTLRDNIAAASDTIAFGGSQVTINAVPNTQAGNQAIADAYNLAASPAFVVWRTTAGIDEIAGCVSLSSFTPTDNAPASGSTVQLTNDALLYQNRALQCQLKQANMLALLNWPGGLLATAKLNVRQALNDGLTNVPSGTAGALVDAGWLGAGKVRLTIQRSATRFEKVFATGTGTQATPGDLVLEGSLTYQDVQNARNS